VIINSVPIPAWAAWLCAVLAASGAFAWCWVACWPLARAIERWHDRRQDGGEDAQHEDMWARMRGDLVHEETRRILADDWLPRERGWSEITGQQTVIPPGEVSQAGNYDISEDEHQAARADLIERFGELPPSLQSVEDRGGRFGRAVHTPPGGGHVVVMGSGHYTGPLGPACPPRPWSASREALAHLVAEHERLQPAVVPQWVADILGHDTTAAAADSIYTHVMAKATRELTS
jgi:hypothetical protein